MVRKATTEQLFERLFTRKKKRNESLDFLCVAIKWEDNSMWVHHTGLRFSIMDISGVTDKVQGDGAQQPTTWQELCEQIWVHQPKAKVSTVTHSTLLHLPTPRGLMLDGLWWCVVVGCAHASVPVQEHRYPTETAVTSPAEFHSPPLKRWQCNTVCRSTECCCVICKHAPPHPCPHHPSPSCVIMHNHTNINTKRCTHSHRHRRESAREQKKRQKTN